MSVTRQRDKPKLVIERGRCIVLCIYEKARDADFVGRRRNAPDGFNEQCAAIATTLLLSIDSETAQKDGRNGARKPLRYGWRQSGSRGLAGG